MTMRAVVLVLFLILFSASSWAHCDSMDGPVIADARKALETRDSGWVLIWVKPSQERRVAALFQKALAARARDSGTSERSDRRFFEQLVRIHRAGEGAAYTGIKPSGTPVDPAVAASDHAIESGSVEPLLTEIVMHLSEALRARYARVLETKVHRRDSIAAGREYVEAYVSFMHYAENIAAAVHAESAEHH